MNQTDTDVVTPDESELQAARRAKMQKLAELGVDPWGQRFDDRSLIGPIRDRISEIKYRTEAGEEMD